MAGTTERVFGSSGLKGVSHGYLHDEFLPQLRGRIGAKQYREMADNDPVIGGILYACEMLMRNLSWRVAPADASAAAMDAAEFLEQVLMEDMAHPFGDVIANACSMFPFGFAPMEIVWKRRNGKVRPKTFELAASFERPDPGLPSSRYDDRRIGIHRLLPIAQDSVARWRFDARGEWFALVQQPDDGPEVTIPRHMKLLNFRTTPRLDNPEGRSLFRTAYVPYVRKKALEAVEGRLANRAAGIVMIRAPEDVLNADQDDPDRLAVRVYLEAMGRALSLEERGSILMPSTRSKTADGKDAGGFEYDVSFLTADSRRPADQSAPIERYDRRMAGAVLADFILVGQQQTGSYSMVKSKTATFANALGGFRTVIVDELNRTLLPWLWELNGMDPELMPTLSAGEFEQRDLEQLGKVLDSLTSAGARMFPDPKLEDWVREAADLPPRADTEPPDEVDDSEVQAALAAARTGAGATPAAGAPIDEELDDDDAP